MFHLYGQNTFADGLLTGASHDPSLHYKVLTSDHFEMIYDAKSYELAKIYLNEAERSHHYLSQIFSDIPSKTIVILDNSTDLANGLATVFPRPQIEAFINPPPPLSTIDEYSFWPRDLILHEYTHILNMESTHGVPKILRTLFGSWVKPNMFLPRWYTEGLAVEMESTFNENGRLKSSDYDALIRALYLGKKWGTENLSQINEVSIPSWPHGQRPYFYGALLMHEISLQSRSFNFQDSSFEYLNQRYSRRFPYFLTNPISDRLGKSFEQILADAYQRYDQIVTKDIAKIKSQPPTRGSSISLKGVDNVRSINLSPDGKRLAVISDFKSLTTSWQILEKENGNFVAAKRNKEKMDADTKDIDIGSTERISWFPDSKRLVFDGTHSYYHYYNFSDLFIWDLETGIARRLTRGLRAREPSVSPDSKKIVYVSTDRGETFLNLINTDGTLARRIYTPPTFARVSHPDFISNTEIVFAQKDEHGDDHLQILDLSKGQITRTYNALKNSKLPTVTKRGIVFTSTNSGVENLYLTSFDFKKTQILTNSLTRIQNGTLDPDENKILYSEMTAGGALLKMAPLQDFKTLPQIQQALAQDFPKSNNAPAKEIASTEKNYHSLGYLFPQYIFPWVTLLPNGVVPSLYTTANDPLGFHSYLLSGYFDSRAKKGGGSFAYSWNNSLGQTSLSAASSLLYFTGLDMSTTNRSLEISHGFYLFPHSERWQFSGGYLYREETLPATSASSQRTYFSNSPSVALNYSYLSKNLLDLVPSGELASLGYKRVLNKTLKENYNQYSGSFQYYHKKWLPDRHALSLKLRGLHSPQNRSLLLSTVTTQAEYSLDPSASESFMIRGYPDGEFLGYGIALGSLAYTFPLMDIYNGPNDPTPFFTKKLYADVFVDAVTLRGGYFGKDNLLYRTDFHQFHMSAGIELMLDTTIFYGSPVTFKAVLAQGFNKKAQGGTSFYTALGAPQLF